MTASAGAGADHAQAVPSAVVPHEVEIPETITLRPVDSVEIVSLMDSVTDAFMPDQGPARGVPRLA